MTTTLRLHGFVPSSRANGPGRRAVLWVQGCSLGCPGCFNPATHSRSGGFVVDVDEVYDRVVSLREAVEGITISGGEPLQQLPSLLVLLGRVRAETRLSSIVLTGYRWQEVKRIPGAKHLLDRIDVLVAGRYVATHRLGVGLRGSANKTYHFLTTRYSTADFEAVPVGEIVVEANGGIVITGIDPPQVAL